MGSYAELKIANCVVEDWKSHVALEPLLMYSADDLVIVAEKDDDGESYETYRFVATVGQARRRLDERGVTLQLCRELYEDFRSDLFSEWDAASGAETFKPNDVTFESYQSVLSQHLATRKYFPIPSERETVANETEEKISREDFFDDRFYRYFADAAFCFRLRLLLESANPGDLVQLDLTELVHNGYLDQGRVTGLYDDLFHLMLRRINLDYKIYGFVIDQDPRLKMRLRQRLEVLSEDALIGFILLPLLSKMGFERLRRVDFHGPGEFGSDVLPFRHRTPLGTFEYYALQAKAVPIHGSSAQPGNAAEILSQATQALAVSFVDDLDNERKRLDKFVVATNKGISASARHFIENAIEGRRSLLFIDADRLIDLLLEYRLAQYVLFSDFDFPVVG